MTELEFINLSQKDFLAYKLAKIDEKYAKKKEKRIKKMISESKAEGENRNKIATAKKMKQCNESIDKIKLYTGLSESQIKNICL